MYILCMCYYNIKLIITPKEYELTSFDLKKIFYKILKVNFVYKIMLNTLRRTIF